VGILQLTERRGSPIRKAAPRLVEIWGREDMVRGEGERRLNRRLTRLCNVFTSHTGRNGFSPLTSFLTLKRAGASYVSAHLLSVRLRTQRRLYRFFSSLKPNRQKTMEPTMSRIEYRGSIFALRIAAIFDSRYSLSTDSRSSSSAVGLAYPYVRAVVGIFRLSQIVVELYYARRDTRIPRSGTYK
jgi:hypothetical protein